jgi:hypothetical protein
VARPEINQLGFESRVRIAAQAVRKLSGRDSFKHKETGIVVRTYINVRDRLTLFVENEGLAHSAVPHPEVTRANRIDRLGGIVALDSHYSHVVHAAQRSSVAYKTIFIFKAHRSAP